VEKILKESKKISNYISQIGYQKLVDEYNTLRQVERPEVTKLVTWAASNGDRSENADYLYGKKRLKEIDSRLRFLGKRIEHAIVVDFITINKNNYEKVIRFGATVLIENSKAEQKKIIIVGEDESDPSRSKVSWKSPFGKELIGKVEGDEIKVSSPSGAEIFAILEVSYLLWD
jgi:transcription elongation factor GreB